MQSFPRIGRGALLSASFLVATRKSCRPALARSLGRFETSNPIPLSTGAAFAGVGPRSLNIIRQGDAPGRIRCLKDMPWGCARYGLMTCSGETRHPATKNRLPQMGPVAPVRIGSARPGTPAGPLCTVSVHREIPVGVKATTRRSLRKPLRRVRTKQGGCPNWDRAGSDRDPLGSSQCTVT